MVFEWNPLWYHYEGQWNTLFPVETYGRVELDTHIYQFADTTTLQMEKWNNNERAIVTKVAAEAPLMIGEWTMAANLDIPTAQLQPFAQFIQDFMVDTGTMGSSMWLWHASERKWWSMRNLSTVVTTGGVDWAQVFATI